MQAAEECRPEPVRAQVGNAKQLFGLIEGIAAATLTHSRPLFSTTGRSVCRVFSPTLHASPFRDTWGLGVVDVWPKVEATRPSSLSVTNNNSY